jgi:cytochrome c oxidase assembly protein subunit 15
VTGPRLHRYARVLAAATWLLVAAGGMVTSTNSGLSVPDWPTTYGYQMFDFPLSKMVGGIFYEHGHRLIASTVGILTIGLVIWLSFAEPRRWVRRLGWLALAAVIAQGVLGGLTVLLLLPDIISISHAALAEVFFCLTVSIALFTSRGWLTPSRPPVDDLRLRRLLLVLTATIYAQILIGATMRHTGAGLAIPDFPLSYGHLVPPFWTPAIAIHFAHRVGALIVSVLIIGAVTVIWRRHDGHPELTRPATFLLLITVLQVTLGALVVLTRKQPIVNTAHVATGALVLATSLVLTLRSFRVRLDQLPSMMSFASASPGLRP